MRTIPDGVITTGISNFTQTAQVIVRCDHVVTSDTVTAHLAPALGIPTLICLRRRADWRWGTPRHPTRWYAMAELLFQDESESWAPVLSAAARRVVDGEADKARLPATAPSGDRRGGRPADRSFSSSFLLGDRR